MSSILYKIVVYETDETTPDFEITNDHLLEPLAIGGQRVSPLRGRAESLSWSAIVGDFSDHITGNMTDGAGRMDLLGRLVEVQENRAGAGYSNVWGGRIVGITETEGPGRYELQFVDERFVESDREVYATASSAQISPPGPKAAFVDAPAAGTGTVVVDQVTADDVLLVLLGDSPISRSILDLLEQDLKDDYSAGASDGITGNFRNLRATVDGNEYEVVSLSGIIFEDPLAQLQRQEDELEEDAAVQIRFVWLAWDGTQTPAAQPNEDDRFTDFVLTMDGAETSETWPHHIGGDNSAPADIISEIKDRYDEHGVRYDADVFDTWNASTNPQGLVDHPLIPKVWVRQREARMLMAWAEEWYAALGLVPFVDADGRVAPRFVFQQHDVDPTGLPEITDDDIAEPVTFDFVGREAVTVVRAEYDFTSKVRIPGRAPASVTTEDDWAADLLTTEVRRLPEYTSDRVSEYGRRVHDMRLPGELLGPAASDRFFRQQATEIFDRWGDGPIYGQIEGLDGVDLVPGDWFRLTVSNYPVFTTGDRDGSTLVCQVMETRLEVTGPSVRFLTGGPDDQPLSAPTVTISQGTRAEHDVDVEISNFDASADRYQLQLKVGSGEWKTVSEGTGAETVTVRNFRSNTTIQARARVTALNTIRSAWSSTDSVTTAALSAPTAVSATATGRSVTVTWTVGETDYPLMLTIDGTDALDSPLPAGSEEWVFVALDPSTQYTFGVKHVDDYGGESALDTDTATTGTANTLPAPGSLHVVQGAGSLVGLNANVVDTRPFSEFPVQAPFGTGVELQWRKAVPWATTVIQYDTDDAFGVDPRQISAGAASRIRIPLPMGERYFFRIKHDAEGFDQSAWHAGPDPEFMTSNLGNSGTVIEGANGRVNAAAVPFEYPNPDPIELTGVSLHLIPAVAGGSRGVYVEVRYTPSDRVTDIYMTAGYNDGVADTLQGGLIVGDHGGSVTPGRENRHQFEVSGTTQLFGEDQTDIEVELIPLNDNNCAGRVVTLRSEDVTETGSGVRAALNAGGTALADYFVEGTDIDIDVDGNGRPRINYSGGASDARLKEIVETIHPEDALRAILGWRAFRYRWNDLAREYGLDRRYGDGVRLGLLAQELEDTFPEVLRIASFDVGDKLAGTSRSSEDFLGIKYEHLVPVLVAAIGALYARIEELER